MVRSFYACTILMDTKKYVDQQSFSSRGNTTELLQRRPEVFSYLREEKLPYFHMYAQKERIYGYLKSLHGEGKLCLTRIIL